MNRTLVFGGARSGKSAHADSLAAASGKEVIHVATADAGDAEMQARVARHRSSRSPRWTTVEARPAPGHALLEWSAPHRLTLVDCPDCLAFQPADLPAGELSRGRPHPASPGLRQRAVGLGGGRAAADDQGRPFLSGLSAGMLPALLRVRLTDAPGPGASAALPSAALYQWWPGERAELFWRTMAGHGIGVRLFKRGAGGIRCGLPTHEAGWRRLLAALQAWKET